MAQATITVPEQTVHLDALTPAPAARPAGVWRIAGRTLRWALLAVMAVLLVRFARHGWPEIRDALSLLTARQAPLIGLAIAVEALWVFAMSQVYRSALMAFGGSVTRPTALRISMAAFTLSRILPGGGAAGGAVAARELIALGNPALRTVVSMLTSWWVTMTGLAVFVLAGTTLSAASGTLPPAYVAAPAAAFAVFTLGGVAIAAASRSPRLRSRFSALVRRGSERLGPAIAAGARREPLDSAVSGVRIRGLVVLFAWGLAAWIFDAAALWLSLAAFGWHADIGVLLVGYGVANLINALPELTPGWLGVLEASVAVTLSAFGVPPGIAVVAVLVYRLVSYWLPTAAGLPAAVHVLGRASRSARSAAPVEVTG